jgi:hypothetical protein
MHHLTTTIEALWRPGLAAGLVLVALLLVVRAAAVGGPVIPPSRIDRWLRGFRLAAIAVGCAATAAGLLSSQVWLIGVGLAFAFEETMETSVCLSALSEGAAQRSRTAKAAPKPATPKVSQAT